MIVYDRLWETMKKKDISQYALIKEHHIGQAQLFRLRKNMVIKTSTLDHLCEILDCPIEDICRYDKNAKIEDTTENVQKKKCPDI